MKYAVEFGTYFLIWTEFYSLTVQAVCVSQSPEISSRSWPQRSQYNVHWTIRPFQVSHHRDICSHQRWRHSIRGHHCRHHHHSVASRFVYIRILCVLCVLCLVIDEIDHRMTHSSMEQALVPACRSSSSFLIKTCFSIFVSIFKLFLLKCSVNMIAFHIYLYYDWLTVLSMSKETCMPVLVLFTHDWLLYRPPTTAFIDLATPKTKQLFWLPLLVACW